MMVYVCSTHYQAGDSEVNVVCSSREVAEKAVAEYYPGAEIEEFEYWTEEDFEESEDDIDEPDDLEMGFDPYEGGYTFDC